MSMIVKVTTEELKKASGEIKTQLDKVRTEFSEIENVMSKTSVYWQSEAADVHRNRFNDKKEDIREAIARLNEQIDDLEKWQAYMKQLREQTSRPPLHCRQM